MMRTPVSTVPPVRFDTLVVHLLGGFRVAVGARAIPDKEWRLRKSRSLTKLLALAPGHQLHREQLLELLWPELSPSEAAHNLHQTLYMARRTLQPGARKPDRFLLLHEESIDLAPDGGLWIDIEAFESAAALARRRKDVESYRVALDLYGGELLPVGRMGEVSDIVDAVIYLRVPLEVVLDRVSHRFSCPRCGATFTRQSTSSLASTTCDNCGETLVQRPDDHPDLGSPRTQHRRPA